MHKMIFYPLGNADCTLIDLDCGKKILFDFADTLDRANKLDIRCDLPKELREYLKKDDRDYFDVVAFTHLDKDHFSGFSDFFYLEYAEKYQGDDRIKIKTMWVPAALITETAPDDDEARILQKEARFRLKNKKGIRIFSRPDRLKKWCDKNSVKFEECKHLVTDAGMISPEFSLEKDGVEFFVHSPFAIRQNDNSVEDRNRDSIVMHATFKVEDEVTRAFLLSDSDNEVISDILSVTVKKKNVNRLLWDIMKLPHHCSYLSLGPDKGKDKTVPVESVALLYEKYCQDGAIIVSTSAPIPVKGTDEDKNDQPPHRQAAAYYMDAIEETNGQFIVTMEHPKKNAPTPVVIEIGSDKATLKKNILTGGAAAISRPAPRAG